MTARKPRTLLTVDWDAFIPVGTKGDPQLWDIGHSETKFHLNTLWQLRGKLYELLQVDAALADPFWAAMQQRFTNLPDYTLVSDSHLHVWDWLDDIQTVVLVDAHHDCWEGPPGQVDCSNWGRRWLARSRTKHLHWVIPDWVDATVYGGWNFVQRDKRVTLHKLSDVLKGGVLNLPAQVDRVHVCRSGCWTPPWLDQAFIDWLKAAGRDCWAFPVKERGTDWDALRLRWSPADLAAMHANVRAMDLARVTTVDDWEQRVIVDNGG